MSIGCTGWENWEFIHSSLPFLSDASARLAAISPPFSVSRHVPPPQSERAFISGFGFVNSDGGMSYLQAYGHLPSLSSPPAESCVWPQGASGCDNSNPGGGRCQKRRITANKKERRRTLSINMAFSELRNCIPQVPADTKLSKIKTLKLATSYIAYLMALLDDEAKNPTPFNTEVGRETEQQSAVRFKVYFYP